MNRHIIQKAVQSSLIPSSFLERTDKGLCPFCGIKVRTEDFRDELSLKEFSISGLCQTCQDKTFGKDE